MKIAFLLPNLKAGGGNRSQIMLANGLAERGHDVSIIVPRGLVSKTPLRVGVKIIEVGIPISGFYLNALINYPLIGFSLARYDAVIVTFSLMASIACFPSCLFCTKRYLFARHYDPLLLDHTNIANPLLLWIYKSMTRLSYELPLYLVVNSTWTGQMIAENTFRKASYGIVNNGIDLSVFNYKNRPKKTNNECKQILVLGKTQKWKGLDDLLGALRILAQRTSNFELVIMTPDDIQAKDALPYKVTFVRPTNDREIATAYKNADVFVSSSWYEGFCNPPLEAMACGTPVALTDSGGVREYATHEYNCLMSPARDSEKLAKNIEMLLADSDLALRLEQNGLKTAQKFTWEKSVEKLENILIQKEKE